jgi:hypothetical protein
LQLSGNFFKPDYIHNIDKFIVVYSNFRSRGRR